MERLHPGGVVDVRGVAFEYEETVTLALIGPEADRVLAEITTNVEGEFTHIVVLPSDLAEGTYYFRATTTHHWVLSPPLTVMGTAITEGGDQRPRDEHGGLPAPVPTFAPGAPTVSVAQAQVAGTSGFDWNPNILILVAVILIGIVVIFRLQRKNLR